MKFRFDKKYLAWGITGFCVLAAAILFYYVIFNISEVKEFFDSFFNVCMPIIFGLIMAYLLSPICSFFERYLLYPVYHKFNLSTDTLKVRGRIRKLSVLITWFITIYALYIFFSFILDEVFISMQSIALQSSIYINNLEKLLHNLLANNKEIEMAATKLFDMYSDELNNWLNNTVIPQANVIIKEVSLSVLGVAKGLWNMVIGLIISVYVLCSKETFTGQAKKIAYALFKEENANKIIGDFRYANKTFGSFISGKIIDSIIIGILCFIIMRLLDLPYDILVSVVVGVTNVIPFFGPFLGGIPCALLILMVDPISGLKFAILILALQQFDGNILGPKILGDSTGLSSFWVIFSITLFGAYFGIVGMAVGVPIFALIYAGIKRKLNTTLQSKGIQTDTKAYMYLDRIENNEMIELTEEKRRTARKADNAVSFKNSLLKFSQRAKEKKQDEEEK